MTVKRFAFVGIVIALILMLAPVASPFLNDYTNAGNNAQPDRWPLGNQVVWNLNPSHGANITGSRSVMDVIQASFNTWASAPNSALNIARGQDSGKTSSGMDNTNLICFVCTGDFTSEAETLAITMTTTATAAGGSDGRGGTIQFVGQILDADIFFNTSKSFSTDPSGSEQDLQTIATHEIGHFFGLAHSAVVRAVMFPFSPEVQTTLSYDDVVTLSVIYPKPSFDAPVGSIAGAVRLGGNGNYGAHVYADSATANEAFAAFGIRKSPIGTLTFPDGSYLIRGLPADSYTVTAEPLDGPVSDSDLGGYAGAFGKSAVQTGFTTRWH
jgi:hypothetical protein